MWVTVLVLTLSLGCPVLQAPVPGPIVRGFAPVGAYGGHWGVDVAAVPGEVVRAAASGTVSFAGSVAGMLSVTVDHGGGLRSSTSFLAAVEVAAGERVVAGQELGVAGVDHGGTVHFSVRVDGRYVDPVPWLRCSTSIPRGLWLLPSEPRRSGPYASRRAPGDPRRDLRPASHGPPRGR